MIAAVHKDISNRKKDQKHIQAIQKNQNTIGVT